MSRHAIALHPLPSRRDFSASGSCVPALWKSTVSAVGAAASNPAKVFGVTIFFLSA